MSSSHRSSSSVRNLLAVFENPAPNGSASPSRGRSPGGSSSNTDRSPAESLVTRKIRTSFISVEPIDRLRDSSNSQSRSRSSRMESTSMPEDAAYTQVNGAHEETPLFQDKSVPTPLVEIETQSADAPGVDEKENAPPIEPAKEVLLPTRETQTERLEKPTSSAQDQDAKLRPADLTDSTFVSAGAVSSNAPTATKKPAKPTSPSSRLSEPTAASKAKIAAKPTTKVVTKASPTSSSTKPKSPRRTAPLSSHLLQPTASSAAKHEPEPVQPKPRSTSLSQKQISVSSHLMAPTAASKARHEPEVSSPTSPKAPKIPAAAPKRDRSSLIATGKPNPAASKRTSLIRPPNTTSTRQPNIEDPKGKTTSTPPSQGFLARMTKPTASSSSKTQEISETAIAAQPKPAVSANKRYSGSKPAKTNIAKKPINGAATETQQKPTSSARSPPSASEPKSSKLPRSPQTPRTAINSVEATRSPTTAQTDAVVTAEDHGKPVTPAKPQDQPTPAAQVNSTTQNEEWNPAALPRTPQTQAQDPLDEDSLLIDSANKTFKTLEPARRSMMETPELEDATIR